MDGTAEWEECADEFGRTFFVHKATGETAWELPTTTTDAVAVEGAASVEVVMTPRGDGDANTIPIYSTEIPAAVDARDSPPQDEATKTLKRCHSFVLDATTVSRLVKIRSQLLLDMTDLTDQNTMADGMTDEEWVQSFDPINKHDYFYECHHGYMTTQAPDVFREVDPLFTVLLVMQCAFRCGLARRRVAAKRHLRTQPALLEGLDDAPSKANEAEPVVAPQEEETGLALTPGAVEPPPPIPPRVKKPALTKEAEAQREADDRRSMMQAEKQQCSCGDRFWGIDQTTREIRRQLVEEKLMREAEDLRRNLHESARKREETQRRAMEELERRRRSEDSALESRERSAMQLQELMQCKTDTFWGVQKQENDEKWCQQHMLQEDRASRQYMQDVFSAQLHAKWAAEAARAVKEANSRRIQQETRHRKQYLRLFKRATTSDDILLYKWPTQTTFDEAVGAPLTGSSCPPPPSKKRPTAHSLHQYILDVVLDPHRRANPKHIFHTASSAHTVGRNGKLEVSQPESCYHLEKPRVEHVSLSQRPAVVSPSKTSHLRNPNAPASANGLPFVVRNAKRDAVNHPSLAGGKGTPKKGNLKPLRKGPLDQPSQEAKRGDVPDSANQGDDAAPVDPRFVTEERVLAHVFDLIDTDRGGTLDKNEMLWALTKDAYVRNVAMSSVVLKDVLKKRSVDALFAEIDHDNTNCISWDRFASYCHDKFTDIMAERDRKVQENGGLDEAQTKDDIIRRKNEAYAARKAILEQEAAIAKIVFALVDTDRSGKIDQHEMMNALDNNDRVREFVGRSRGLRPLLENEAFGKAFVGMATDEADGMSLDEFLAFCTEIASVAMLNDLAPP